MEFSKATAGGGTRFKFPGGRGYLQYSPLLIRGIEGDLEIPPNLPYPKGGTGKGDG